jgi:hypothetical protein
MTKSYAFHSGYFNGPDDNPDLDFAGYCDWLDSLEPADLDEQPTPARAFKSGDTRPWELPATDCPVCGSRLEDGAPVCVKCLEDALVFEGDCLACSGAPALSHSGLCGDCTLWACEREDEAARREIERQRKEMYQ